MKMKKKQFVYCTFQMEGHHAYPGADTNPKTKRVDYLDVSHLASRHMHYFNFKVWVEVKHTNRDIEFIQLRRWILKQYEYSQDVMISGSCEMISDNLAECLSQKYPGCDIMIDVSEEGINGSYTEYKA
jgi:hypothetical protein